MSRRRAPQLSTARWSLRKKGVRRRRRKRSSAAVSASKSTRRTSRSPPPRCGSDSASARAAARPSSASSSGSLLTGARGSSLSAGRAADRAPSRCGLRGAAPQSIARRAPRLPRRFLGLGAALAGRARSGRLAPAKSSAMVTESDAMLRPAVAAGARRGPPEPRKRRPGALRGKAGGGGRRGRTPSQGTGVPRGTKGSPAGGTDPADPPALSRCSSVDRGRSTQHWERSEIGNPPCPNNFQDPTVPPQNPKDS